MNAKQIAKMIGRSAATVRRAAKAVEVHGTADRTPIYRTWEIDRILRHLGFEPTNFYGKG